MVLRSSRKSSYWAKKAKVWIIFGFSLLGVYITLGSTFPCSDLFAVSPVNAPLSQKLSRDNHFCPPHDSSQYGVLYFAYHLDPVRTKKIMANVIESIKSLRQHNSCLKVAVASNHPIGTPSQVQSWGIDDTIFIDPRDIIEGPKEMQGRQWWTRTVYLSKTPYDYTVQLDSDRTVCGDISELFQQLHSYDFIGVSAGILPGLDNGVMAWKKSAKFDRLIERWSEELLKQGKTGNDQPSLAIALDSLSVIKAGVMNPTFQAKYIPAIGEFWGTPAASRTLVLHGPAKIVAGNQSFCSSMNQGSPRPRIALQDYDGQQRVAFSQEECETYLKRKCGFKELDWDLDFNIMFRRLYLEKYM